ncbi:hypothetical protein Shyd_89220 [Streptomyces hydrogenans]|uniref:Uncharacterized protein n=1 Tax=Streptomyces hydrogenans TaxID=1873719 RepID=A0ABQ3PRA6_9ACTN|nr:hypothetical protein GCM10018784_41030 [Streptomyces hydrogenans]GHI27551.1 hypothetical protein Shyd_89220 [Streptomyces hydrogenans]
MSADRARAARAPRRRGRGEERNGGRGRIGGYLRTGVRDSDSREAMPPSGRPTWLRGPSSGGVRWAPPPPPRRGGALAERRAGAVVSAMPEGGGVWVVAMVGPVARCLGSVPVAAIGTGSDLRGRPGA